ncbi:MAG: hypothetical protein JNM77_09215 [Pseudonocardia sp.]|nr:hypothetical protein [Pseudonocardia sp.]
MPLDHPPAGAPRGPAYECADGPSRTGAVARLRLDTDLTVAHDDGRVETFHPATAASGDRAYWGASHGLLIDDFYRHVRAGKHFWIDAPAALETLRVIQAAYDQSPR